MIKNTTLSLFMAVLVIFASGCSNVKVTIESPDETTVYTDVPEFRVSWEGGGSAEEFTATLNGEDITDRFDITDTTATLNDPSLISELRHNKNLFIAQQGSAMIPGESRQERNFFVDLKGPRVQVLHTQENVGSNTFVTGSVWDPSGVDSLSYSTSTGQSGNVTINEDDTFTVDLVYSDPNEIVFTATDNIGQVSTTTFYRTSDGVFENTLNFRADIDALSVISEVAPDLIASLDVASFLVSDEPIVEIGVLTVDLQAFIDDASLSVPQVDVMSATVDGMDLDLDVLVEDLDIEMRLCADFLILPTVCQEAYVDTTSLYLDITTDLGADNEGALTVEDMIIDYEVAGLGLGLNLFNLDALKVGIPDILKPITDAIVNLLGNFVVDLLRPLLSDIITTVLSDVPFALNLEVQYAHEETPRTLDIGTFFDDVYRDGDDLVMGLGLGNDVTLFANTDPLGVRSFGFSPATSMYTPSGVESDFVFSLSADFLNHLLHDLYRAGIFNVDIPAGTVGGSPAMVRLSPNEPPHMSIEDFDLGMAELHVWSFSMIYEVQADPEDPGAGYNTVFNATLDMDVPVNLTTPGDGTLGVELSNQLSVTISDLVSDGGAADEAIVNAGVSAASGPIVNAITSALQQIELPEILGMNIVPVEIWADKANGTFIIAGDLELAPNADEEVGEEL